MTADADPRVPREALRRRLEQARIEAGASHAQVAAALGWSLPDLLLVAAVADGVDDGRLAALMSHYGIPAEARDGVQAPPAGPLNEQVRVLTAYEGGAEAVRTFEPFVIPGLLQTRAYAESVLRFYAPPEGLAALVDARLARHPLLEAGDGPSMTFLLDESALHRWTGADEPGRALMREQLEHIRRMARLPRVRIQVIPYAAGVHEGVKGPFVILDSADPILYLEDAKGDVISVDADDVRLYGERFEGLAAVAAGPEELDAFLDRALTDLT